MKKECRSVRGEPMVAAGSKEATVVIPLKKEARFGKLDGLTPVTPASFVQHFDWFSLQVTFDRIRQRADTSC